MNDIEISYYSNDIWDYLVDMSYMPSRQDRDRLVKLARQNRSQAKRLRIWDYFFRIREPDVGKPQKFDISKCKALISQEMDVRILKLNQLESSTQLRLKHSTSIYRKACLAVAVTLFAICLVLKVPVPESIQAAIGNLTYEDLQILSVSLTFFALVLSIALIRLLFLFIEHQIEANRLTQESVIIQESQSKINQINHRITKLDHLIERLKRQMPVACSDTEIKQWLEEDIDAMKEQSMLVAKLGERKVLGTRANPNSPIALRVPGELQQSSIPRSLMKSSDYTKHLSARHFAEFENGDVDIFYGVYCFEFYMITESYLGTYRCFYDFVRGQQLDDFISDQYYEGIEGVSLKRELREIQSGLSDPQFIENAPTIVLLLESGRNREITYENLNYVDSIQMQLRDERMLRPDLHRIVARAKSEADEIYDKLVLRVRQKKDREGENKVN